MAVGQRPALPLRGRHPRRPVYHPHAGRSRTDRRAQKSDNHRKAVAASNRRHNSDRQRHTDVRRLVAGIGRDAALTDLDAGEASAIALAALETDVLLLIDESAGRLEASRRGIPNTGTLGVLRRAAIEHLVDLPSALNRLLATNFRVSKPLVVDLLAEAADRKRQGD